MEWALVMAGIIGLIAAVWMLATRRGSPVEMPGGETIFGSPSQPERPSPQRTVEE
jgi:sugar phosphate permease